MQRQDSVLTGAAGGGGPGRGALAQIFRKEVIGSSDSRKGMWTCTAEPTDDTQASGSLQTGGQGQWRPGWWGRWRLHVICSGAILDLDLGGKRKQEVCQDGEWPWQMCYHQLVLAILSGPLGTSISWSPCAWMGSRE